MRPPSHATTTHRARRLGTVLAGAVLAVTGGLVPATAQADPGHGRDARTIRAQVLSFNDFHGHLEPDDTGTGGAARLAGTVQELRSEAGDRNSVTVSVGDNIGGSTFLSGLFHDEPTVEVLEALGLDVSAVGNHEFDEGVTELQRMQQGGCHPEDGCYVEGEPYDGADFPYLAANVVSKDTGEPILPGSWVTRIQGAQVGFVGVVTTDTAIMVSPAGIADVEFTDEAEAANREVARLKARGVESIVLVVHDGGTAAEDNGPDECRDLTGPITEINATVDAEVDAILSGHTHDGYVCTLQDPEGNPRTVTQAGSWGSLLTELNLYIDLRTKDVRRDLTTATNHAITTESPVDAEVAEIVSTWKERSAPLAAEVVGTVAEDVTGDAGGDRGIETPMADLMADSILYGTSGDNGGAQLAFMNVGGVRASFLVDEVTNGEAPGEITYAEAYAVAPFGNQLVTLDMTGEQIKRMLEQQYQADRGRQMLALGVSKGFSYSWDPDSHTVVAGSMTLNGEPMAMDATYRVATLNFLADGGDGFSVFTEGTNRTGGPEDLANLVAYLQANPGLVPPADRVSGL